MVEEVRQAPSNAHWTISSVIGAVPGRTRNTGKPSSSSILGCWGTRPRRTRSDMTTPKARRSVRATARAASRTSSSRLIVVLIAASLASHHDADPRRAAQTNGRQPRNSVRELVEGVRNLPLAAYLALCDGFGDDVADVDGGGEVGGESILGQREPDPGCGVGVGEAAAGTTDPERGRAVLRSGTRDVRSSSPAPRLTACPRLHGRRSPPAWSLPLGGAVRSAERRPPPPGARHTYG